MRRMSKTAFVLLVLMVFALMAATGFGKPSNTKNKQAKAQAKKLAVSAANKPVGTGNREIDSAQSFLTTGVKRLSQSLEGDS
jgi:hypothetical protein